MSNTDRTPMAAYMNDISEYQLLTDEQEQQLAARIAAGDEAAVGQLVTANLRFVVSMARNYAGQGMALDDLISEGNIGLMRAAAKFRAPGQKRFVVFAAPYVRRSIEEAISRQVGLYRVPASETTPAEEKRRMARSVDEPIPIGSTNNYSLLNVLEDADARQPDDQMEQSAMLSKMAEVAESLPERDREVVCRYYGIGHSPATMAEVAVAMGLKRERVRQILKRALRRLRRAV